MTESSFGNMKANDFFKRFNQRDIEKNYKEFLFHIIGRNLLKLYRYETDKLTKYIGDPNTIVT